MLFFKPKTLISNHVVRQHILKCNRTTLLELRKKNLLDFKKQQQDTYKKNSLTIPSIQNCAFTMSGFCLATYILTLSLKTKN